jgi:hypothetical protein
VDSLHLMAVLFLNNQFIAVFKKARNIRIPGQMSPVHNNLFCFLIIHFSIEDYFLEYDDIQSGRNVPTFRRYLLSSDSAWAAGSSETLVLLYQTKRHHVSEDSDLHIHRGRNFRSCILTLSYHLRKQDDCQTKFYSDDETEKHNKARYCHVYTVWL